LLSVSGHNRGFGASAECRIAAPTLMFAHQARAFTRIAPRTPRLWLDEDLDLPDGRDADQTKTKQPAELFYPGIADVTARRGLHRQPNLIAGRTAVNALKDELKVKAKLEFANDHDGRGPALQRDHIATANLAFNLESEALKVALYGRVERGFRRFPLPSVGSAGQAFFCRSWRNRHTARATNVSVRI
jgi:hypothetical protein